MCIYEFVIPVNISNFNVYQNNNGTKKRRSD